ncbi:xanthine dehydrogenase family protein molybdopterin-binding subunit [Aquabacter sp. L1I39]|uniref:xanthine dehydrogenase family protein molybdopterin-binding subunit n=1 Tax=Aquabacter sp. L1I39 TaxID=2820278 RepID=UPI001ADCB328|nr:molybdopterin cofactor-binding domain-containing protein [Aquabacter sp. L1I39]QTL02540.1 xanthine dehydrogenase family protein molybdopterin-binding subunit [Aquabacter sp. L1I39]
MTGPMLPGSLRANPRLGQWLRLTPDGTVHVSPGKVEIGQGILTALATIAADALEVERGRIRMVPPSTVRSPDEGVTSGSLSVQDSGRALRHVGREVRQMLVELAAARMGVDPQDCRVEDGIVRGPGNGHVSYFDLAADLSLDRPATLEGAGPSPAPKSEGGDLPRLDVPDKVFGRARFIHDLRLPGLRHGRVVRPTRTGARLERLDELGDLSPDVVIVRDGNFLGVVGGSEESVDRAAARLKARAVWEGGVDLPDETELEGWLRAAPCETTLVDRREGPADRAVAQTLTRRFSRPFIAHASIAPCCALARWEGDRLEVWSHSQGIFMLRADLARTFARAPDQVVVNHVEGAGCYGHNGADDVALDAALLARACPGEPVRVQWTREDELANAPFGAAMAVEIGVDLDGDGEVVSWRHDVWSNGHSLRPGRAATPTLLAASEMAAGFPRPVSINMPLSTGGGSDRNAVPLYDFPDWRITNHRLLTMPVRTSALRALGAFANVFAIEQVMDELARARDEDPLAFRLRHLKDPRALAVLEAVARRSGWPSGQGAGDGTGRGLAYARYKNTGAYCAVVADVLCEEEVRVRRLTIAVDVGEVISRDGVLNQIEGGAVQATSWTLKEAVRFDREGITSRSWATYPILTFAEVPAVDVEICATPGTSSLGAGEASQGPTAAAIANAVFDAIGVRVRRTPITRDAILSAME